MTTISSVSLRRRPGGSNSFSTPLFDDPDADIILRSCDSQEFRVLKMYITKSSPVLKRFMQGIPSKPPDTTILPPPGLPVVEMPDSGAILFSLLTFIFPVLPILPKTIEETMELLSVAQKYQMSSILCHIRGRICVQDPPLIHRDNAFHVYSLARKHRLFQEAAQAARITLKFTLTIEELEGKLDVIPGAYLYELWRYHRRVQIKFLSDIMKFRTPSVRDTLIGLACVQLAETPGVLPEWLDDHIYSIAYPPSLFDLIETQAALSGYLTDVVHLCMEEAESALFMEPKIIQTEPIPSNSGSKSMAKTPFRGRMDDTMNFFPLPKCLDTSGADVVIQSSDHANFPFHKSILASSSQIFRDMFSLPQPSKPNAVINKLPVVHVSEKADVLLALITLLYPIPPKIPSHHSEVLSLLAAAQKYEMFTIQSYIRAEVSRRRLFVPLKTEASVYAIARKNRLLSETRTAARLTLYQPLTFESLGVGLQKFDGYALCELAAFRKSCQDSLISCFESFLDIQNGPSNIWNDCSYLNRNYRKAGPILPSWLRDLFKDRIRELKEGFTNPLLKLSSIREEYLGALRVHIKSSGGGCSCCTNHALQGEKYCKELGKKVAGVIDSEVRLAFSD